MHTPRLPVVDWTNAPCRYNWTRPFRRKTKSSFCACAITFQTQSTKVHLVQDSLLKVNICLLAHIRGAHSTRSFWIPAWHTHTAANREHDVVICLPLQLTSSTTRTRSYGNCLQCSNIQTRVTKYIRLNHHIQATADGLNNVFQLDLSSRDVSPTDNTHFGILPVCRT